MGPQGNATKVGTHPRGVRSPFCLLTSGLTMTAGTIVSNACKQAGLVEDGTTTSIVSTLGIGTLSIGGGLTADAGTVPTTAAEIGLAILNRWYL